MAVIPFHKVWLAIAVFYSVVVLHSDVYYMTLWKQHLTNLHNTDVPCIQRHIPHTFCLWRHNDSFQDTARNNSPCNVQVWDNLISIEMTMNITCFFLNHLKGVISKLTLHKKIGLVKFYRLVLLIVWVVPALILRLKSKLYC